MVDCCLIGCDPLRGACFTVLNMVARDWSRTSIHRLLPLHHQWVTSHFSQTQVVSGAYKTHWRGDNGTSRPSFCACVSTFFKRWWWRWCLLTGLRHIPGLAGEVSRGFRSWPQTSQVGGVHLKLIHCSLGQALHLPVNIYCGCLIHSFIPSSFAKLFHKAVVVPYKVCRRLVGCGPPSTWLFRCAFCPRSSPWSLRLQTEEASSSSESWSGRHSAAKRCHRERRAGLNKTKLNSKVNSQKHFKIAIANTVINVNDWKSDSLRAAKTVMGADSWDSSLRPSSLMACTRNM